MYYIYIYLYLYKLNTRAHAHTCIHARMHAVQRTLVFSRVLIMSRRLDKLWNVLVENIRTVHFSRLPVLRTRDCQYV